MQKDTQSQRDQKIQTRNDEIVRWKKKLVVLEVLLEECGKEGKPASHRQQIIIDQEFAKAKIRRLKQEIEELESENSTWMEIIVVIILCLAAAYFIYDFVSTDIMQELPVEKKP